MIRDYRDRKTARFAKGGFVKDFESFSDQAAKRLAILDAATSLNDLRSIRSNRLEVLKGDRTGQYSIRINSRWRICFSWILDSVGAEDVEIVDYH